MTDVCLYFQVHQPHRLNKYTLFQIGKHASYFDEKKNKAIMQKVAQKCYLPANRLIRSIIAKHDNFKVAYSISGTALEQFEKYTPKVLESFQELASTGAVELLAETSHHSLSSLYDAEEFKQQVCEHGKLIKKMFKQKPKVFRNTELIFNNEIGKLAEQMGYKGILAEGWDSILGWRSPNYVYKPANTRKIKLLLKNYRLSDDVAFRFSNKDWEGYPLTADKYASWIAPIMGDTVNLFMDYETIGEHQWEDTGIFEFLKHLPMELKKRNIGWHHPTELTKIHAKDDLDVPHTISWADVERDTSAWLGNDMQKSAIKKLYQLKKEIYASNNKKLIEDWRKLTTSDHFYYMCTKWFNDGDVHKYFSPYNSPYEAFIAFMNIIQDFENKIKKQKKGLFSSITRFIAEA